MAFKIVVSNTVKFKVQGTMKDESGRDVPFDFLLTADRLSTDEVVARLRQDSEAKFIDFLLEVVSDWSGIKDANDKPLEFTEENFRAVGQIAGVAQLMFNTYFSEVGAKAKN